MDWPKQCAIIVPCFNEAGTIAEVVRQAKAQLPYVIVVDDGSVDATHSEALGAGAEVVTHPVNLGKGAALRVGCEHAARDGFSWAILMDGDGQHSANDIPKFLSCAERTDADLIVGDRMGENCDMMPVVRRLANRWMSHQLSRLTGRKLPDSQCGFRLVRLEAWKQAGLKSTRFEIESEMLVAFSDSGCLIEFAPIEVIYKQRSSKIHPLVDSLRWWKWWRSAKMGTTPTDHPSGQKDLPVSNCP